MGVYMHNVSVTRRIEKPGEKVWQTIDDFGQFFGGTRYTPTNRSDHYKTKLQVVC